MVDFGIQSYFFKKKWLYAFWKYHPINFEVGEDIHLAATFKIELGINSIVPMQTHEDTSGNLKPLYGLDEYATWRKKRFIKQRSLCLHYLIDNVGWKPKQWD